MTLTQIRGEQIQYPVPMMKQDSTYHVFGGFQGSTEEISIGADTWVHITNIGNNLWTGLEVDGFSLVADELIVTNTGDYCGTLSLTFSGGNGKDYLFRIYNLTQVEVAGYVIGASGAGDGNYTNACIPLYLEANAGDHYQMQIYEVDGTNATMRNAIFYLAYLHE